MGSQGLPAASLGAVTCGHIRNEFLLLLFVCFRKQERMLNFIRYVLLIYKDVLYWLMLGFGYLEMLAS